MPVVFADAALAARLEGISAAENERFGEAAALVHPEDHPAILWVAGGCAVYCSPGGPLNQVTGLGFSEPVTAAHIDELERFFGEHGAKVQVNVCPLADPSLMAELSRRGYAAHGFENVLVRELLDGDQLPEPDPSIDIRIVDPEEFDLWGEQVARGFATEGEPTEADLRLGEVVGRQQDVVRLLAWVDGEPAGTAELAVRSGIGWLSADTTMRKFRGMGIQTAMQQRRLHLAREAGCGLAVTEAHPGSGSQRNMERLGFRIVYTRIDMLQTER
ncbi:MAG: hypothetical protein D9V44_00775 [Actinobacteria bacterium]|nr:MAG: hypothetical protein D9V44_00775 [Actinomycetota bacterium]